MFSGWTMPPNNSKETELESSDKKSSQKGFSNCKNTGIVLVPCHAWKFGPIDISGNVDIPGGSWMSFITTKESSVRVTKVIPRISVSCSHSLPFSILSLF